MSDPSHDNATPSAGKQIVNMTMANILAQEALRREASKPVNLANKQSILAALAAIEIAVITWRYDGYGDSGQFEELEVRDTSGAEAKLPAIDVDLHTLCFDYTSVSIGQVELAAAIEAVCYEILEQEHDEYENGEGGFGEFVFDVANDSIKLTHNDRYIEVDTSEHEV